MSKRGLQIKEPIDQKYFHFLYKLTENEIHRLGTMGSLSVNQMAEVLGDLKTLKDLKADLDATPIGRAKLAEEKLREEITRKRIEEENFLKKISKQEKY